MLPSQKTGWLVAPWVFAGGPLHASFHCRMSGEKEIPAQSVVCLLWWWVVAHSPSSALKKSGPQGPGNKLEVHLQVLTAVTPAKEGALFTEMGVDLACLQPRYNQMATSLHLPGSHCALVHTYWHLEVRHDHGIKIFMESKSKDQQNHTRVTCGWRSQTFEQWESALSSGPFSDNSAAEIICFSHFKCPCFLINSLVIGGTQYTFRLCQKELYLPFPGLWHMFLYNGWPS